MMIIVYHSLLCGCYIKIYKYSLVTSRPAARIHGAQGKLQMWGPLYITDIGS